MKQESPEFGASIVEEEVDYVSKEDVVLEENSASEMGKTKQEYSEPQASLIENVAGYADPEIETENEEMTCVWFSQSVQQSADDEQDNAKEEEEQKPKEFQILNPDEFIINPETGKKEQVPINA